MRQEDLFDEEQPGTGVASTVLYRADPEKVRAELKRIIGEIRAAATLPWDEPRLSYYRIVVPQMSLWLPEDEAAQIRLDFEAEIARLGAA